jgi:hypothetical protein
MHSWRSLVWIGTAALAVSCSAGGGDTGVGTGPGGGAGGAAGAGGTGNAGTGGAGTGGTTPDASVDGVLPIDSPADQSLTPETGCATSVSEATQAEAAMLVVLDRSQSMSQNNKWMFAATAIVQAVDQNAFDTMWLGLYAAPSGLVTGPACIMGLQVACAVAPFPQVEIKLAGAAKSGDPSGVRHNIKAWLGSNFPATGMGDASPMYAALQAAIMALQGWPKTGKRILLLVTDGTLSCNQFSTRPGFKDCNGCDHDWENPNNIVTLLGNANKDAQSPIETFVVGVPGADTYDATGCNFPPYHMRLALSAMAYAGSPQNVDPACTGTAFTQAGGDPSKSCHFDMTQGKFDAQALADTISQIRGKALGCVYELPTPEGGTVDKTRVNVEYAVGDAGMTQLKKRSDPSDGCQSDGCWDYDNDGKVVLVGKACEEVKSSPSAKVQIVVGCQTVLK